MVQEDWMDVVKPHCLTLGNVRKFEKGQSYRVVCFHRNFGDELSNAEREGIIEQGKRYTAQDFFQKLQKVDVYMHREGVSGRCILPGTLQEALTTKFFVSMDW